METKGSAKKETGEVKNEIAAELEEMRLQLDVQQKQIDLMKAQRDNYRPTFSSTHRASKIVRADHPDKNGGYIIKIPTKWSGERMGVMFVNGVGIIDENHPDCDMIAHWMEADYHYKVLPASERQINDMRRMLAGSPIEGREESIAEKLLNVGQLK